MKTLPHFPKKRDGPEVQVSLEASWAFFVRGLPTQRDRGRPVGRGTRD